MTHDKSKYDALIESKTWESLTEAELAELGSAGIGREEYELIRNTLKGFGGLSDLDEGITMRPEARARLMEMFDAENRVAEEETDPRIIRIRNLRRLYIGVAAAAAVILVASVWWLTLRDDGTEPLIPVTEIAEYKTEQPEGTTRDDIISPSESPFRAPGGQQTGEGEATAGFDGPGRAEKDPPATIAQIADSFNIAYNDPKIIADVFSASEKETDIGGKEAKTIELSSKKITIEATSEPGALMEVVSGVRVTRQGAPGRVASGSATRVSSAGRPVSDDAALLRFLYACR